MKNIKVCSKCILDEQIPGIYFDETGVCNYCAEHSEKDKKYPQGQKGEEALNKIARKIREDGKNKPYDCILGISGGADSTYSLLMAKKLGLRPLAVLFDNGFSSEIAVANIKSATDILGVDLETFVVDYEEFKSILKSFLYASVSDTDIPTDIGIKATLYKLAQENGIKYIITGGNYRTEGRIPREWSYMDGKYIRSVHKRFSGKKLKNFPNLTLLHYAYYIFVKKIQILPILNYLDYDKDKIKKIISDELNWRDYGGKHFESIFTRFNQTKIRYQKFGYDMRLIEYAALVRSGQIEKEKALEIISKPPFDEKQLEDDTNYVIKKLGISKEEFKEIFALPLRTFHDYPTYFPLIEFFRPLVNIISKYKKRL